MIISIKEKSGYQINEAIIPQSTETSLPYSIIALPLVEITPLFENSTSCIPQLTTEDDKDDDEVSRPKSKEEVDRINKETGNFDTEDFNKPYYGTYDDEDDDYYDNDDDFPFSNN